MAVAGGELEPVRRACRAVTTAPASRFAAVTARPTPSLREPLSSAVRTGVTSRVQLDRQRDERSSSHTRSATSHDAAAPVRTVITPAMVAAHGRDVLIMSMRWAAWPELSAAKKVAPASAAPLASFSSPEVNELMMSNWRSSRKLKAFNQYFSRL